MRPKHRILSPPTEHAYVCRLYEALAHDVTLIPWTFEAEPDARAQEDCDGFHVHWPEHMMPRLAALHHRLIVALKRREVPILWTQHNLGPHRPSSDNDAIYRAWAAAADAVVHHSVCGMRKALATLPYSPAARHRIIPHGWLGEPGMRVSGIERRAAEAARGLRHGVLRLGVIGAPRPGKRVDLVMEAVARSAREDIELVAYSLRDDERPPHDHRIVAGPYCYVPQNEFDIRLGIIDLLVLPFDGDHMLTTGSVADAIGRGLPCLTSPWCYLVEMLGDAALPYGSTAADLRKRLETLTAADIEQATSKMAALRSRYDWKRIGARYLRLWDELAALRSGEPGDGDPDGRV